MESEKLATGNFFYTAQKTGDQITIRICFERIIGLYVLWYLVAMAGVFCASRLLSATLHYSLWQVQMPRSEWRWWALFACLCFVTYVWKCILEALFHRYVLHGKLIRSFSGPYRKHDTEHHDKHTKIKLERINKGDRIFYKIVSNRYPITSIDQIEFATFNLGVFWQFGALHLIPMIVLQLLLPQVPVFSSIFLVLAFGLWEYETVHAANHIPATVLEHLFTQPHLGGYLRERYDHHLIHHANRMANLNVGTRWGDILLGTLLKSRADFSAVDIPRELKVVPQIRYMGWLDRYMTNRARSKTAPE